MAFELIATILSTTRAMQAFNTDKSMQKGTFTYFMLQQGTLQRTLEMRAVVYADFQVYCTLCTLRQVFFLALSSRSETHSSAVFAFSLTRVVLIFVSVGLYTSFYFVTYACIL